MMRLHLYGFQLEIERTAAPHPLLADALSTSVRIKVSGGEKQVDAVFARADVQRFGSLLKRMHESIGETLDAVLWSADGKFVLSLGSGKRGQVDGRYQILGHPSGGFTCDQTHLLDIHRQVLELEASEQMPASGR